MARTDYPADTAKLLALIPTELHTVPYGTEHGGLTPLEYRHNVDEYGCRGCRVALWRLIDEVEAAGDVPAAQPKESK